MSMVASARWGALTLARRRHTHRRDPPWMHSLRRAARAENPLAHRREIEGGAARKRDGAERAAVHAIHSDRPRGVPARKQSWRHC